MKNVKSNLIFLVAGALVLTGCSAGTGTATVSSEVAVVLEVDFQGEAIDIFSRQKINEGDTAMDLLELCQSKDSLKFDASGGGETAFVNSINGVKNQLADGSNWIYFVNGEKATVGPGVKELSAGDTVLWKFSAEY